MDSELQMFFARKSMEYSDKYDDEGNPAHLSHSILDLYRALELCHPGSPDRPSLLCNLGSVYVKRYEHERDQVDLQLAIKHYQEALQLHLPGDPDLPKYLNNLAMARLMRYDQGGEMADLSISLSYSEESLRLRPPGHPDRAPSLHLFAMALGRRYEREGDPADLDLSITYFQVVLELRHPGSPQSLSNLGLALKARYSLRGDLADLEFAITYCQKALQLRPPGHPKRPGSLHNLALILHLRYEEGGDMADLSLALAYSQEALELQPPGRSGRPTSLYVLAGVLQTQYEQEGDGVCLRRAISYLEEVLEYWHSGHPRRSGALSSLGDALKERYEREGDLADLGQAIIYLEEAIELSLLGQPNRTRPLHNLADALMMRYERAGDLVDLRRATAYREEVLERQPFGHPGRPNALSSLAMAIRVRYERGGDLADLELAITYLQEASEYSHGDRVAQLNNLALTLKTRYEQAGDLADLGLAITYYQEVLGLCPSTHVGRHKFLSNLSAALRTRYEQAGDPADLELAISYLLEAVELMPPGHLRRPTGLSNLSNALVTRYKRTTNRADIELAITHYREAVGLFPLGNPERHIALTDLGVALLGRYRGGGNLADLELAISYFRQTVELTPHSHPNRPAILNNLAIAVHDRYRRCRDPADFELAAVSFQELLGLWLPGHPSRSLCLMNYGGLLFEASDGRFGSIMRINDSLQPAAGKYGPLTFQYPGSAMHSFSRSHDFEWSMGDILSLYREASQSKNCSPRICLEAALRWVRISESLHATSTLEAYAAALHQFDLSLALGQSLNHRLLSNDILAGTKDLGCRAATWALKNGEFERAVELLEQGRSLLFAQVGRYRVELDDLRRANSKLADRFAELSRRLDAAVVSNQQLEDPNSKFTDSSERYRRASADWDQTIEEIRATPGFASFLKPIPYEQLRKAAADGPIVILIPNETSSNVLIVREHSPIHYIELPLASSSQLTELSDQFNKILNPEYEEDTHTEVNCVAGLKSLWEKVVQPIAHALQHDLGIPLRSRIWWCPTGAASFLPLHGAGLYSKGRSKENFPNLYVSSYTPTVQALLRARKHAIAAPSKMLIVVSEPDTHDKGSPLPYAKDEAEAVARTVAPTRTVTELSAEEGTCKAVQLEMESHSWIHFICHGIQDHNRPLDSYLCLNDGHLTLRSIMERNLPNADFVFLAACHSAAGDRDLSNEVLHLAAATQFAGFRGVVGTLWKMGDETGPELAKAFYEGMVQRGDSRRAALALANAIRHLRRKQVKINRWVRFVHIGV